MSGVSGFAAAATTFSASSVAPRPPSTEDIGRGAGHVAALAIGVHQVELGGRVGCKLVDGDDDRLAEVGGTVQVRGKVDEPALDGAGVGAGGLARAEHRRAS